MTWETHRPVRRLIAVAEEKRYRHSLNDDDRTVLLTLAEQDVARARFTGDGRLIWAMGRTNQRAPVWTRFPAHAHTPKPPPAEVLENLLEWIQADRPAQWEWRPLLVEVDA